MNQTVFRADKVAGSVKNGLVHETTYSYSYVFLDIQLQDGSSDPGAKVKQPSPPLKRKSTVAAAGKPIKVERNMKRIPKISRSKSPSSSPEKVMDDTIFNWEPLRSGQAAQCCSFLFDVVYDNVIFPQICFDVDVSTPLHLIYY